MHSVCGIYITSYTWGAQVAADRLRPSSVASDRPTSRPGRVKTSYTKSSLLGKDFDFDESVDAPSYAQQVSSALRQVSSRVLDFFREIDTSSDGLVSRVEFCNQMRSLGLDLPVEQIQELFNLWDLDHSNDITFEELRRALSGSKPSTASSHPSSSRSQRRPSSTYSRSSVLGKGFVLDKSPEALPVAQQIAASLRAQSSRVLDFFREVDASGDGRISKEEFCQSMRQLGLDECDQAEMDQLLVEWDLDHDGFVSFEELRVVLTRPGSRQPTPRQHSTLCAPYIS